jgi:adenosylhomocysteine nucleosidase
LIEFKTCDNKTMNDLGTASIVVLLSADAEWNAVRDAYSDSKIIPYPYGAYFKTAIGKRDVLFAQGGWGKISAAASTQFTVDHFQPKLVINLGTCGGFAGSIECGQTILVNEIIIYDIIEQMSDPDEAIQFYSTRLDLSWLKQPFPQPVILGRLLSADRDIVPADIPMLKAKYQAIAADWESGSIAWVCRQNQVPCLILRTVSDVVDETGSEFYDQCGSFAQKAADIMANLLENLPGWLECCDKILK